MEFVARTHNALGCADRNSAVTKTEINLEGVTERGIHLELRSGKQVQWGSAKEAKAQQTHFHCESFTNFKKVTPIQSRHCSYVLCTGPALRPVTRGRSLSLHSSSAEHWHAAAAAAGDGKLDWSTRCRYRSCSPAWSGRGSTSCRQPHCSEWAEMRRCRPPTTLSATWGIVAETTPAPTAFRPRSRFGPR